MNWGGLALTILMGSVACSAVSRAADWSTVTAEDFSRQLGNATGYFVLSRLLRDHAVERGASASVILLGSMYGVVGSYPDAYEDICAASPVAYHALKGSIVHSPGFGWKSLTLAPSNPPEGGTTNFRQTLLRNSTCPSPSTISHCTISRFGKRSCRTSFRIVCSTRTSTCFIPNI